MLVKNKTIIGLKLYTWNIRFAIGIVKNKTIIGLKSAERMSPRKRWDALKIRL